jgi:plasmid stabilization system protein ParE
MRDTYRIVISPRAADEIDGIFNFIAQESPQNASLVVDRILEGIFSLETMPRRYKVERRSRKFGYVVHSLVVPPFLVFYRVMEEHGAVRILCVQHGARRHPRSFE